MKIILRFNDSFTKPGPKIVESEKSESEQDDDDDENGDDCYLHPLLSKAMSIPVETKPINYTASPSNESIVNKIDEEAKEEEKCLDKEKM